MPTQIWKSLTATILTEVHEERKCQIALQYDHKPALNDRDNSQNDWVAYICAYAGRGAQKVARNEREGCSFRENMVKVAALAVAAIESYDEGHCPDEIINGKD